MSLIIAAKAAMDARREIKTSSFSTEEILAKHANRNGVNYFLVLEQFNRLYPGLLSFKGEDGGSDLTKEELKEIKKANQDEEFRRFFD